MKALAFIEVNNGKIQNGSIEAIGLAKTLGDASAVVIDKEADNYGQQAAEYGVDTTTVKIDDDNQDKILYVLEQYVKDEKPDYVLISATLLGKDIAPRLAARLDTGCISDVVAIDADKEQFVRPAYGGSVLEHFKYNSAGVKVLTLRGGSFTKPEITEAGKVSAKEYAIASEEVKIMLKDTVKEISEKIDLEGANVVVSGGRGMGSKEGFQLVVELANLLGGEVGATRAAVDEEWTTRAHQVGQSGKNVAPKLYIACGLSGAMQHVSGIMDSDYIVAINKDEDAPIFEVADMAIVGRCEDILPLMIDEIKAVKGL